MCYSALLLDLQTQDTRTLNSAASAGYLAAYASRSAFHASSLLAPSSIACVNQDSTFLLRHGFLWSSSPLELLHALPPQAPKATAESRSRHTHPNPYPSQCLRWECTVQAGRSLMRSLLFWPAFPASLHLQRALQQQGTTWNTSTHTPSSISLYHPRVVCVYMWGKPRWFCDAGTSRTRRDGYIPNAPGGRCSWHPGAPQTRHAPSWGSCALVQSPQHLEVHRGRRVSQPCWGSRSQSG